MRQSQLFTKTIKEMPKDEASFNAQALIRAGLIDKLSAGVYTVLPLGLRVIKKIENIIREEINNIDGQEIYMPALHPIENYRKTGRENIDVLYHTKQRNGVELVLGQSHEEIIVPLMQKFVSSYKDLPKYVYQFQTKFRNELRAKAGMLRGREFIMKDLYSFHVSVEDLNSYYKLAQKAYFKIFERCGLLDLTYLTFASGGTFSKYSHEFQTLAKNGEDIIYICDDCKIAINREIIEEQKTCPNCNNKKLQQEKAIEVGNIFKLKTKFSNAFDFKYTDERGEQHDVVMGCYGIGLGRVMGTIVEVHHDDKGIIWPQEVAPAKVHLISLNQEVKAELLYEEMKKAKIDVLYDDRVEASAGEKFAEADLIGCPIRIVVSDKTIKKFSVELKRRDSEETELVKMDEVVNKLK